MRTVTGFSFAIVSLINLFVGSLRSQSQLGAVPMVEPFSASLPGCSVPCACKWRVTMTTNDTGAVDPATFSDGSGFWKRRQDCHLGRPSLFLSLENHGIGATTAPLVESRGWLRFHLEHIDMCAQCPQNASLAGWSMPQFSFSGSTAHAASYETFTRMQVQFSRLFRANNLIAASLNGSSGGFGGVITMTARPSVLPTFGLQVGATVTVTLPTQSVAPSGALHSARWQSDRRLATEELLTMVGEQRSLATADAPPTMVAKARAHVSLAEHFAGFSFLCKCNACCSPGHPLPPTGGGSGTGSSQPSPSTPSLFPHTGGAAMTSPLQTMNWEAVQNQGEVR